MLRAAGGVGGCTGKGVDGSTGKGVHVAGKAALFVRSKRTQSFDSQIDNYNNNKGQSFIG
jgi:hypothetical protein